jgi:ABC-type uncharacterized transport system ATPase subunit
VADHGVAVLLVEHNLPVVFGVADTVTALDQGLVVAAGPPEVVAVDPELSRSYLGRRRSSLAEVIRAADPGTCDPRSSAG